MHKDSMNKLLNAGFVIVNAERRAGKLQIWGKSKEQENWHLFKNDFTSKAQLKREMIKLLKEFNIIDLYDSLHKIDNKDF